MKYLISIKFCKK